uniref:Uncharacterized protein n=1 Tax=Aureoumbra lagunensis TaxID=44058 RepID=A0A7S3K689_9STRA|mmetsp:Transcript_8492/g.13007  ORF Transcript_8492/g.13007 Transcript_8492/m.13007 type:complete len:459 (-) Transcript_8492:144-1520(-)
MLLLVLFLPFVCVAKKNSFSCVKTTKKHCDGVCTVSIEIVKGNNTMTTAADEGARSHRFVLSYLMKSTRLREVFGVNATTARYFSVISNLRGEDSTISHGLYFTAREGRARFIDANGIIIKGGQLFTTALYFAPSKEDISQNHHSARLHSLGTIIDDYSVSHNINIIREGTTGHLVGLGGAYAHGNRRSRVDAYFAHGLSNLVSRRWLSGSASTNSVETSCYKIQRNVLDGGHDGCYEARHGFHLINSSRKFCQFDGKHSLVHKGSQYYLYSRMNMRSRGGRFIQVARSVEDDVTGSWLPYKSISFADYDEHANIRQAKKYFGNIYFGAINLNPVNNKTLIGLFPVSAQRKTGRTTFEYGYIGMAISCDGIHFSKLVSLIEVPLVLDGRPIDMPVDGFAISKNGKISFFVHRNLPGVADEHPEVNAEASVIAQYEISRSRLERYTYLEIKKMSNYCPY